MKDIALAFAPGLIGGLFLFALAPLALRLPWPASLALRLPPAGLVALLAGLTVGYFWLDVFMPWHSGAAFGAIFMVMWFAFGAVAKSVTLAVCCTLESSTSPVGVATITNSIIATEFSGRVEMLRRSGHVSETGGRFSITPAGMRSVFKIAQIRDLLNVRSRGIYGWGKDVA